MLFRNTAKKLHSNADQGQFFTDFTQAAHNYDTKSEDFQFSLARLDARSICVYQGGKQVGAEESILVKIGFNHARQRHPLLHKDDVHMRHQLKMASHLLAQYLLPVLHFT
jgi:hypothetical protein